MSDPFSLLGLKKTYFLDQKTLENAYFKAQKKTHPDQFATASEVERHKASLHSMVVNQAYLLLKDPLARADYLLQEMKVEESSPDADFLEKVLDLGEKKGSKLRECEQLKEDLRRALGQAFEAQAYLQASQVISQLRYVEKLLKE